MTEKDLNSKALLAQAEKLLSPNRRHTEKQRKAQPARQGRNKNRSTEATIKAQKALMGRYRHEPELDENFEAEQSGLSDVSLTLEPAVSRQKGKQKRAGKTYAEKAKEPSQKQKVDEVKALISKATGLPRSDSTPETQSLMVRRWKKAGRHFIKQQHLHEIEAYAEKDGLVLPTATKKLRRVEDMCKRVGPIINRKLSIRIISALANYAKLRQHYELVCAIYGVKVRQELDKQKKKPSGLVDIPEGAPQKIKQQATELRQLTEVSVKLQQEWQKRTNAFNKANAELKSALSAVQSQVGVLRASVKSFVDGIPEFQLDSDEELPLGGRDVRRPSPVRSSRASIGLKKTIHPRAALSVSSSLTANQAETEVEAEDNRVTHPGPRYHLTEDLLDNLMGGSLFGGPSMS